jgi:deazaflavin-dependent oxidoreductase (nitroreductase family)
MTAFGKRPGPFLKFFFKFPVWLHKIGFGGWERMIGAQWMLITTIGRKSGKRRETMVDVMDYDQGTDTYYIEVAYGNKSDWYRNIQANPIFEAKVGRCKFRACATELSSEITGEMLVKFYREKPAYTRSVMMMVGMKFNGEDELREIAKRLKLLAIHPE